MIKAKLRNGKANIKIDGTCKEIMVELAEIIGSVIDSIEVKTGTNKEALLEIVGIRIKNIKGYVESEALKDE